MVIKDSEASRVNLRFRDRIEKINDLPVCELSHEDIVERVTACPILHMRITPIIRWSVELERNGIEGYGFGIRGGKEFDLPLYVLRILESSPAEKSCLINVGDVIEAINDDNIGNKTHAESVELITKSLSSIKLCLRRGNGTVPVLSRSAKS